MQRTKNLLTEPAPRSEEKREQVLQAAARCFVKSGFHGARMAQIAAEAEMSPGHIYHYFESKEQIIAEMVRAHAREKQASFEQFEQAGARVVDMMIDNLEEKIDSSTDPFWSALLLEMTAEATRNPEIAATIRDADADMKARVIAALSKGASVDEIETRLEILIALFQGLGIRNILNPGLDKPAIARLVKTIVENLLRGEK